MERLREKLLSRGLPSYRPPPLVPNAPKPELTELVHRVRPFAEAMYLVIAADAEIAERERDVLRGALRTLTDGALSSMVMESLLREFEMARAREGSDLRLDAVASALYGDPADAELALGLAIAAGEVDHGLDAREQVVVFALAERLGISRRKVDAMLEDEPMPVT
jgi:tellurite resistance protein